SLPTRPRPPPPTLFPYTTLFRSARPRHGLHLPVGPDHHGRLLPRADRSVAGHHGPERLPAHGPHRPRLSRRAPPRPRARHEGPRSEEHTSELQSRGHLVCRLLLE